MDELIQSMKKLLGTTFAFYIRAHGCHWNVEGQNFTQFHDLFAEIYEEVYGAVDPLAENIRKLGSYAPASFARFSELSDIVDEVKIANSRSMLEQLLADNEIVLSSIAVAYKLAEQVGEHGISNFLADRQDQHQKHAWKLTSTLKQK